MGNKEVAIEFLRLASAGRVDEAYVQYVAPGFRHHNAYFRGDAASLRAGMAENAAQFPDKTCEVKQALEDGARVATLSHVRLKPGDRGIAVAHIFRFEDGRIAELWDLGQPVPEEIVNENGMF